MDVVEGNEADEGRRVQGGGGTEGNLLLLSTFLSRRVLLFPCLQFTKIAQVVHKRKQEKKMMAKREMAEGVLRGERQIAGNK